MDGVRVRVEVRDGIWDHIWDRGVFGIWMGFALGLINVTAVIELICGS